MDRSKPIVTTRKNVTGKGRIGEKMALSYFFSAFLLTPYFFGAVPSSVTQRPQIGTAVAASSWFAQILGDLFDSQTMIL